MLLFQSQVLPQLCRRQCALKLRLLFVQLVHTLLCRVVEYPSLDCPEQIGCGFLHIRQRLAERFRIGTLRILRQIVLISILRNKVQQFLIVNEGDHIVQNKLLDPHTADRFLVAEFFPLPRTVIIVMACARFAGSADPNHHSTTFAAKQFLRQQIVGLGILMRRRFLIVPQHLLYLVEQFRLDDGRDGVLNSYLVLVGVNANVLLIFQHCPQAVICKRFALLCPQASGIKHPNDLCDRLSLGVELIDKPDGRRGFRVDDKLFIWPRFVAQRPVAAGTLSLGRAGTLSPPDVLGQLLGVIGRHALDDRLQNNALRGVGNHLGNVVYFHTVLFQVVLIQRDFFLIASDAVCFPDDQGVKGVLGGVGQHELKLLPVVIAARLRPVAVFVDDGQPVGVRVFLCLSKLAFNGLLTLAVAGIAGVDDCIHSCFAPFTGSRSRARRAVFLSFKVARS